MIEGRKRGVIFDVGFGGGSFVWRVAVPALKEGFYPDSISTDLHTGSMNNGMKDMLNVMSKFLAMGVSVDDVIADSTSHPAHEIHHDELGNLSVGAIADVAVLPRRAGIVRLHRYVRSENGWQSQIRLRVDREGRPSGVRLERNHPPEMGHAAEELSEHR